VTYFGNYPNDEHWGFIPQVGPSAGSEVSLQSQWWNIGTWGASRYALPTLRGQDYEQPYRTGQQWRAKYPNSRTCTLAMWTAAISQLTGNPDTTVNNKLTFNNNLQQLRALFFTRGIAGSLQGQLVRRWYLTLNGVTSVVQATAMAEIAGSMEPTMNGRFGASFAVDLLLSDPYFYGAQQVSPILSSGNIFNAGEGVVGESYPSLINAFTIALSGATTVTNSTYGVSFSYNGPVTNLPITVDVLNMTATDAAGNNVISGISHSGARMWMALVTGANAITTNNAVTATFSWSPPYV
jgi:hypothetical protein